MTAYKIYAFILVNIFSILCIKAQDSKASFDSVAVKDKRIKTNVYLLNSCNPSEVSLRKKYEDDSLSRMVINKMSHLEVHSSGLSSFIIEGINPLRYKYYINNEEVTQFLEDKPETVSISKFYKEGYFLNPDDIYVPEIFKTNIEKSNIKSLLEPFVSDINLYKDSLYYYHERLYKIGLESSIPLFYEVDTNGIPVENAIKTKIEQSKQEITKADLNIQRISMKLNYAIDKYTREAAFLPISSSEIYLLKYYQNLDLSKFSKLEDIYEIEHSIRDFANLYDSINITFKVIDALLNKWNQQPRNYSSDIDTTLSYLNKLLLNYGYQVDISAYGNIVFSSSMSDKKLAILDTKIFLMKKRYQIIEEYFIQTITIIGVMLQKRFRETSQYTNTIGLYSCIDDDLVDSVQNKTRDLSEIFDFVQKTSNEFQTLLNYLDIDNKLYSNIAFNINSNYFSLLSYLEKLSVIDNNNIIEYTLPSTSNLRNIDLVRYKIDREDKISGSKQTYVYDLWVRGGLKIDFSAGIYLSGLINDIYQKKPYYFNGILTDSVEINRQNIGKYGFGFGGMVNISPRWGTSWVKPGLSFGAILTNNQKLQLLTTATLQLGKTERINLHFGAAFGFVSTIDLSQSSYIVIKENSTYRVRANFEEYTVPTLDKFTIKPVFGITYNLSKQNQLQAVVDANMK